jgi:hypothetical protein
MSEDIELAMDSSEEEPFVEGKRHQNISHIDKQT